MAGTGLAHAGTSDADGDLDRVANAIRASEQELDVLRGENLPDDF